MSLNKFGVLVLCLIIFTGCQNKNDSVKNNNSAVNNMQSIDYNNKDSLHKYVSYAIKTNPEVILSGKFDNDTAAVEIFAGSEVNNKKEWGIRFYSLKPSPDGLKKEFESNLCKGSFKKSLLKKINIKGFNYDLVFYNSLTYFMGASFGEVFSYIIDLNNKQVYYAHLFTKDGDSYCVYMSQNTMKNKEIKSYLFGNLQRDYPRTVLVNKDVDLDEL